jgi:hypothetical protein
MCHTLLQHPSHISRLAMSAATRWASGKGSRYMTQSIRLWSGSWRVPKLTVLSKGKPSWWCSPALSFMTGTKKALPFVIAPLLTNKGDTWDPCAVAALLHGGGGVLGCGEGAEPVTQSVKSPAASKACSSNYVHTSCLVDLDNKETIFYSEIATLQRQTAQHVCAVWHLSAQLASREVRVG